MSAQELSIEKANRDVKAVESKELQIFFLSDVDFLEPETSVKVHLKFFNEIIAKRALIMGVERYHW